MKKGMPKSDKSPSLTSTFIMPFSCKPFDGLLLNRSKTRIKIAFWEVRDIFELVNILKQIIPYIYYFFFN